MCKLMPKRRLSESSELGRAPARVCDAALTSSAAIAQVVEAVHLDRAQRTRRYLRRPRAVELRQRGRQHGAKQPSFVLVRLVLGRRHGRSTKCDSFLYALRPRLGSRRREKRFEHRRHRRPPLVRIGCSALSCRPWGGESIGGSGGAPDGAPRSTAARPAALGALAAAITPHRHQALSRLSKPRGNLGGLVPLPSLGRPGRPGRLFLTGPTRLLGFGMPAQVGTQSRLELVHRAHLVRSATRQRTRATRRHNARPAASGVLATSAVARGDEISQRRAPLRTRQSLPALRLLQRLSEQSVQLTHLPPVSKAQARHRGQKRQQEEGHHRHQREEQP